MSSRSLSRFRKTITFRLTVWYAVIFIASSIALFVLSYLVLYRSLRQNQRDFIWSKLNEYVAQYGHGGSELLLKDLDLERQTNLQNGLLIRVADAHNRTVYLSRPVTLNEFDLDRLGRMEVDEIPQWLYLRGTDEKNVIEDDAVLEVASLRLPDGSILQVGKSTDEREDVLERFRNIFAGVTVLVVLAGFSGGAFLAMQALRPIRRLLDSLQGIIRTGQVETRVPVSNTGDEIEELSRLLNTLLEKIESLIRGMRGSLDNVAHDLRTPMTRLRGTAEMALRPGLDHEVLREALTECVEESERILTMLNTLMDISEAETGVLRLDLETVNVCDLMAEVIDMYGYVAEERGVAVVSSFPSEILLTVDRNRIQQVLANLLDNAIKFTPQGGRVRVGIEQEDQLVSITVADSGMGIPQDEIPKIWDRLYRGDNSRSERGLGLGLSLVRAIVQAHGGRIECSSTSGTGSTFTLCIERHSPIVLPSTPPEEEADGC